MRKIISILTPCFNEEENAQKVYEAVAEVMQQIPQYDYEHVFIDNDSTDATVAILKGIATNDKRVKIIVNARNFGHLKSPYYGMQQCTGDAIILFVADLQDPAEMIKTFIEKWEQGHKIVVGVKNKSEENRLMFLTRKLFYSLLYKMSSEAEPPIKNFTGFGLYDRAFIDMLKTFDEPDPYFRGMITQVGFKHLEIPYTQPQRKFGKTKNNIFTLYDTAMLGFTNHSKLPLRLSAVIGFFASMLSLLVAIIYFILKIIFWNKFQLGLAPLVCGIFFFSSIQLFFIGIIGEYIGAINTHIRKRPLVIEKERINF